MDLERVLQWPRETWSDQETAEVRARRAEVLAQMVALTDEAERFDRPLTSEEAGLYEELQDEFAQLSHAVSAAR